MSRSGYEFYLDKCLLPVVPSSLQIKINNANRRITLINEGEINLLKNAGLTSIEFECDIPQVSYPFANYKSGFVSAESFLETFEKLKTDRKPFQFIVVRSLPSGKTLFSTNIKVSLEDYTIKESAEIGFDCCVSFKLKQYREYGTKTVTLNSGSNTASVKNKRSSETNPVVKRQTTYKTRENDTAFNISKYFYGDGSQYEKIISANSDRLNGGSNLVPANTTLTIPPA